MVRKETTGATYAEVLPSWESERPMMVVGMSMERVRRVLGIRGNSAGEVLE